jgi:hypothetical protein
MRVLVEQGRALTADIGIALPETSDDGVTAANVAVLVLAVAIFFVAAIPNFLGLTSSFKNQVAYAPTGDGVKNPV